MLEELFRALMPQQGAFSPDQMDEFRRRAAALPAAPSGQFLAVPPGSPDRQAGQLLPLQGGQPIPEMAPILGESDGRVGLRGAVQADIPRAILDGPPLNVQTPPPPPPKDAFSPPTMFGATVPGMNPKSDSDERQWFDARGGMTPQQSRADFLSRDPMMAARFEMEQANKAASPAPAAPGSPEDTVRRAFAFRDQIRNETSPFAEGYTPGRGYAGPTDRGNQAMQLFMALQGRASDQAGRMDLQRLENQGRQQSGGGDVFNTAKLKALEGIRTGQITPDQFSSSMKLLSGEALRSPEAMASAVRDASAQAQADAEVGGLRSLLGVDPKTGVAAAPPTGQAMTALIDRMGADAAPRVAAAIKAGQFGDPIAVRNAAANSLAQNYLMSQGRLPGGEGNIPGRYTIPYGDKPILDMIATPPTNMMGTIRSRLGAAQSGVPYTTLRLPDGTQIPFDQSGVQGLSNMAATLGYNQSGEAAKGRLSRIAQLLDMLQNTPR